MPFLPLFYITGWEKSSYHCNCSQSLWQVVVPDGRSVYWRESSLDDEPNQLQLYGATVNFDVQWESNTTSATSSEFNSSNVIVVGLYDTALWFQVTPTTSTMNETTMTLMARLSVENVVAVNGSEQAASRKLMLLTLTDVQFLLLPASFHPEAHISRLSHGAYDRQFGHSNDFNAFSLNYCVAYIMRILIFFYFFILRFYSSCQAPRDSEAHNRYVISVIHVDLVMWCTL